MIKCMDKVPEKFEDAITKTGFGIYNIFVILIGGGCLMCVIMETMGMMFVIPAAECDLNLDLTTKGLLASISFFGVVSSSHLWGFLADTKGRRNILLISMLSGVVTSLLSSIAPTAWLFILMRFFNGFFIGGASAVIYAYVGEFHNYLYRPRVVTWIATFVALGTIMVPALSWLILPLDFKLFFPVLEIFRPWRLLVICIGLPSLFFGIGLYCLPESPKCLLSQGDSYQALEVLEKIYAWNTGKKPESFPVSKIIWEEDGMDDKVEEKTGIMQSLTNQTLPLFKFPYLTKTFMVSLLQFGAFATSSGLIMWFPDMLNKIEHYSSNSMMCEAINNQGYYEYDLIETNTTSSCTDTIDVAVYETSIILGAVIAVLYIISGYLITNVGAKNLLIIFFVITTSCGIAAQFVKSTLLIKSLVGIFLMESSCVGIINAITVDLYPTHLRGMAMAISLMAGRFGAVAGSHLCGQLVYKLCDYTFYILGFIHLILIVTTILLPSPPRIKKLIVPVT